MLRPLFLSLFLFAASLAHATPPTWGVHGMVLFGGQQGLYASHLPMFHAPHDYQVVLQVHLADPALDARLRAQLDGRTALWTLEPERFELARLLPDAPQPLRQFRATVVRGHFEKDGQAEPGYADAAIVVERVLLMRQLSPAPAVSASARYLQVGDGTQRFLVKHIDSRPDFEHIVAWTSAAQAPHGDIVASKSGVQETPASVLRTRLGKTATLRGTLYFSTEDVR
ncbi:hypothetical protein O0880_25985 [Janthinobacterium sp. SUN118]|uniref:hypothetical protein n=1 Tax=Janthinobacterium sp. SUN118 TaxID=3004100 RepID=UPI0025B04B52|nr:hypothetical protein [Janthinobacterium sp. SUN118]MDN2712871.1 hypothetical protein [Janthinobacterium sp. SUN118]